VRGVQQPRENLQLKITQTLAGGNDFVSYIDAIGELDGKCCLIDWKTTSSRYSEEPEGLLSLDPQLICYSWISGIPDVAFIVFVRKQTPEIQYLKATISEEQLMAIHENLAKVPKQRLKALGWSKAVEMVKIARRDGDNFDCATWLHKADELPKEEFKRAVEKHLTGKEAEPWELMYFKVYKSQVAVIERALAIAALMLGSDKSRGYTLEMICADFLAGASLEKQS
jgi:hypothetical protein